jgi:MFS family permease
VYLVAFVESAFMQFFAPAEKALLPRLVDEKHLVTANSLSALNINLGMLIGPAIGGALMGLTSLTGVVLFDSASYFIAGVMIFLITWSPDRTAKKPESVSPFKIWSDIWLDWLDGLKLVTNSRPITTIFVAASIAMLGEGIIMALLVLFVNLLKGGALEFGWLLTLRGLGGLLGGLIFGQIGTKLKPQRIFPWTLVGIGLFLLLMFNYPVLPLALISLCFTGILSVGASASSTTMLQNGVSDGYLGRIFGVFGMIAALMTLLGQGSAGALADRWGVGVLLNIGGGLYVLSGFIPLVMWKNLSETGIEITDIM